MLRIFIPLLFFLVGNLFSAPFLNVSYSLAQPDGSLVPTIVSGDEYYQEVRSPDGRLLVRNSEGWICYAIGADVERGLLPGERYTGDVGGDHSAGGAASEIRVPQEFIRQTVMNNRALLENYAEAAGGSVQPAPGWKTPSGTVLSLTLIIDFSDQVGTENLDNIETFLNSPTVSVNGNNGSVRKWFTDVSQGKIDYQSVKWGYYRASKTFSYYDDGSVNYGTRAKELVLEALAALNSSGFNFSQLTSVGGSVPLNVLYSGAPQNGWSTGMWPHKGSIPATTYGGKTFRDYQVSALGEGLKLATFIHENGHMLLGYPDLYPYVSGVPDQWVRGYCTMGYGGVNNPKNPVPYNPYFRYKSGWVTPQNITSSAGQTITLTPNDIGDVAMVVKPGSNEEILFVDARSKSGRSNPFPSQGLLFWLADESGSNTNSTTRPLLRIVEADNNGSVPQAGDYFANRNGTFFSAITTPAAKWYDGTVMANIGFHDLSAYGTTMNFGNLRTSSSSSVSSSSSKPSSSSVSSSSGVVGTVDCQGLSAWTAKSYDWVSNNPPGECFTYQGQKWCHHHWVNEVAPPQNSGWTLYGTCATGSSSSVSSSSSKPSSSSVSSSMSSSSSKPSSSSVSSSSSSSSLLSSSSTSSSSSDPSVSSDAPSSSSTDDQTGGIDRIAELSPFRVITVDRLTYRIELPESSPWQLVGWNGRLLQQGLGSGVVDLSPYSDGLYLLRALALGETKKLLRTPSF